MTDMPTTAQRPATDRQIATIDRLFRKAVQNDDDQWTFAERYAIALGYVDENGYADLDAASKACERQTRDRISSHEARAQITVLGAMAKEPRCTGYCGLRGVQHSAVRYYDDHYDYECGLS